MSNPPWRKAQGSSRKLLFDSLQFSVYHFSLFPVEDSGLSNIPNPVMVMDTGGKKLEALVFKIRISGSWYVDIHSSYQSRRLGYHCSQRYKSCCVPLPVFTNTVVQTKIASYDWIALSKDTLQKSSTNWWKASLEWESSMGRKIGKFYCFYLYCFWETMTTFYVFYSLGPTRYCFPSRDILLFCSSLLASFLLLKHIS